MDTRIFSHRLALILAATGLFVPAAALPFFHPNRAFLSQIFEEESAENLAVSQISVSPITAKRQGSEISSSDAKLVYTTMLRRAAFVQPQTLSQQAVGSVVVTSSSVSSGGVAVGSAVLAAGAASSVALAISAAIESGTQLTETGVIEIPGEGTFVPVGIEPVSPQ